MAILKNAGVRATFFETGSRVHQNSELRRKASIDGHTIGNDASFIRLPFGDTSEGLSTFFKEKKLISVEWNRDAHDWQITDARLLFDRILKELDRKKCGILQMWETSEATAIALPYLLLELRARGFTTVVFVAR